jgi:hypothetical protein
LVARAGARDAISASTSSTDAWLDALPGKHRTFIDASTVRGGGSALLYAYNLYAANKSDYSLADRDVAVVVCFRLAICEMATHGLAGSIAADTGGTEDAVYRELVANAIPNARMVAAGVLAVNRAQEYGYTLLTALMWFSIARWKQHEGV